MKILYVVDEMPSISTPFILYQIIGQIELNNEIHIWSRKKGDFSITHEEFKSYKIANKTTYSDNINNNFKSRLMHFIKKGPNFFFTHPILFFKSINFMKFKRYAANLRLFEDVFGFSKSNYKNFDIIHAQFGPLGQMTLRLKEIGLVKGKLITHFRGYDLSKNIKFEGENIYDYLFREGDYFLANSNYFMNKAIQLGCEKAKISTLFSGVHIDKFSYVKSHKLYSKKDLILIGSVGRLTEKKGYEFILKAIKQLIDRDYNIKYEIVGSGELKRELELLIEKLNLKSIVKFHGSMNHLEISKFLKSIDLFISHNITSKDGDQDAPVNTLKEAMLSGNIVFSTYHGGIPELVENKCNGFLNKEKDVNGLVKSIEENFFNNKNLDTISENARRTIKEKYDIIKLNLLLNRYYMELLEN